MTPPAIYNQLTDSLLALIFLSMMIVLLPHQQRPAVLIVPVLTILTPSSVKTVKQVRGSSAPVSLTAMALLRPSPGQEVDQEADQGEDRRRNDRLRSVPVGPIPTSKLRVQKAPSTQTAGVISLGLKPLPHSQLQPLRHPRHDPAGQIPGSPNQQDPQLGALL